MSAFQFHSKREQTLLLGKKARNVRELLEGIRTVPPSCIYFHTHRFLQQHHFLSPEPPNDFAYWVAEVLNDDALGEKLSSVDIVQFHRIADLRNKFVTVIESHLSKFDNVTEAPVGQEFHFMASRAFVLPTRYKAENLDEFLQALQEVSVNSLYFHVFDAKLRLERGKNDFSNWFEGLGYDALAEEVSRLDPYTHTLEGLRKRITTLVRKYDAN